jgi:hypothetical protein
MVSAQRSHVSGHRGAVSASQGPDRRAVGLGRQLGRILIVE